MANKQSDEPSSGAPSPPGDGRRQVDRRKAQEAHDNPERRKGERRSGTDRRNNPRT